MPGTPKILIVDDELHMCDSLRRLLSQKSDKIQIAYSGRQAIRLLAEDNFDLVLLDIVMPDMDGYQVMNYVNSQKPEIPVIVMTGYASTESAIEALRRGAYDYLKKPFKYEELLKAVNNALSQKRLQNGRSRAEEELLRAQKLQSVGILAAGIAHDFNNLLTGILGNIALAKISQKLDPEVFQMLNEAEKAALRAQHLTNQLLAFSKAGASVRKTVSISRLLMELTNFALRGSNIRCEFAIPQDLWLVEIDKEQISQVINNLVVNARHAMSESGTVGMRAKNLIVGAEHGLPLKDGRYVQIAIEDHGTGIPEEHLPKIFDPYFSTKEKGRGLGLAVSYSIIQKHDGYIHVKSGLGVGTTFYAYLPASEKQMVEGREKDAEEPVRGEGRILVMDDEEIVQNVAMQMLNHIGYEVELARDGTEAIKRYEEAIESGKPFDAVILDLTVPGGMGGKEAIKKLMEIDPGVKGIVSSGYSDDPVMAEFEKHGFRGVIPKPYTIEELGKTLHEVMTREDK